jgi:hypothetical protein
VPSVIPDYLSDGQEGSAPKYKLQLIKLFLIYSIGNLSSHFENVAMMMVLHLERVAQQTDIYYFGDLVYPTYYASHSHP